MGYNVFLLPHIINALRVFLHSYSLKTVQCMSECSVCVQLPHIVLDAGRAARCFYAVRLNCHATEANEPSGTHCVTGPPQNWNISQRPITMRNVYPVCTMVWLLYISQKHKVYFMCISQDMNDKVMCFYV